MVSPSVIALPSLSVTAVRRSRAAVALLASRRNAQMNTCVGRSTGGGRSEPEGEPGHVGRPGRDNKYKSQPSSAIAAAREGNKSFFEPCSSLEPAARPETGILGSVFVPIHSNRCVSPSISLENGLIPATARGGQPRSQAQWNLSPRQPKGTAPPDRRRGTKPRQPTALARRAPHTPAGMRHRSPLRSNRLTFIDIGPAQLVR